MRFLEHRIGDTRGSHPDLSGWVTPMLRLIRKRLGAGGLDEGADDTVVGFAFEADARRFQDAMRERLAAFALSLHPDKTRLIAFGRFAAQSRQRRGLGDASTGSARRLHVSRLTFVCSKSRQGRFQLRRESRGERMRATLNPVTGGLRRRMHQPVPVQGRWLKQVVTGYFINDHAVPTSQCGASGTISPPCVHSALAPRGSLRSESGESLEGFQAVWRMMASR